MKVFKIFLVVFFLAGNLFSQPSQISLQGILKDSAGNKLNGSFAFTFNFYEEKNSTQPVYGFTPSEKVEVVDGLFSVVIDLGTSEIFKDHSTLWVGVKVEDESEFPKIQIVSTGYAIHSKFADFLLKPASDVACNGCIGSNDIADGAVSGVKIAEGTIDDSRIASVSWNKITGIPSDIQDGDQDTTYSAGNGLKLDGTTFSLADEFLTGEAYDSRFVNTGESDSITNEMIVNGTIKFEDLSDNGCNSGEVIKFDGSSWMCASDEKGIVGNGETGYLSLFSSSTEIVKSSIKEENEKLIIPKEIEVTSDTSVPLILHKNSNSGSSIYMISTQNSQNVAFAHYNSEGNYLSYFQLVSTVIDNTSGNEKGKLNIIARNNGDWGEKVMTFLYNGSVGIGTETPNSKLDVHGEVKIGNSGLSCSATTEGSVRYNSTLKTLEFCNGTKWVAVAIVQKTGKTKDQASLSCKKILDDGFSEGNGIYWIDPDGDGDTSDAFQVYCDMETDGGGWTLIAKICANDGVDHWTYNASIYKDDTLLGDCTDLNKEDAKGKAYLSLPGTELLIKSLNGNYYAVHSYAQSPTTWKDFINSIWNECGYEISGSAKKLVDDNRDSVIGSKLFFHHYDAEVGNCSSQERSMFAEVKTNAGWTEVGIGLTEGNATYLDAQSGPSGATQQNQNVATQHEDYAFFIR